MTQTIENFEQNLLNLAEFNVPAAIGVVVIKGTIDFVGKLLSAIVGLQLRVESRRALVLIENETE